MFCAISGAVPKEPVFSPKTGYVYEKSLITKALEATSKCPVTGTALSPEDVVVVNPSKVVTPRPPTGNSIPALLETMATEWDSLMLETFELRKQLQTTREELVRTLYERDAACRVIARLSKERDEAKAELARASSGKDVVMKEANGEESFEKNLKTTANELSTTRRQNRKVVPAGLRTKEELKGIKFKESVKAHKTSKPGILCCAVDPKKDDLIVTGGADGQVIVTQQSKSELKAVSHLSKHSKSVIDVSVDFGSNTIVSASMDKTAIVWRKAPEGLDFAPAFTVTEHKASVVSCAIHPTKDYVGTVSHDGSFLMASLSTGKNAYTSKRSNIKTNQARFHPDGLLIGYAEADGCLSIWDVVEDQRATQMKSEAQGPLTSLSFSENGFTMATTVDNVVQLWDLRKQKVFNTLPLDTSATACTFDQSGYYFGVGDASGKIHIYSTKEKPWEKLATLSTQTKDITGLSFGGNAGFLASSSQDRSLSIFE